MQTCKARLMDRYGEYFGTCEVPLDPPEVIMLPHWPGRAFVRDRKNDQAAAFPLLITPTYREYSFGLGQNFALRSGA